MTSVNVDATLHCTRCGHTWPTECLATVDTRQGRALYYPAWTPCRECGSPRVQLAAILNEDDTLR